MRNPRKFSLRGRVPVNMRNAKTDISVKGTTLTMGWRGFEASVELPSADTKLSSKEGRIAIEEVENILLKKIQTYDHEHRKQEKVS